MTLEVWLDNLGYSQKNPRHGRIRAMLLLSHTLSWVVQAPDLSMCFGGKESFRKGCMHYAHVFETIFFSFMHGNTWIAHPVQRSNRRVSSIASLGALHLTTVCFTRQDLHSYRAKYSSSSNKNSYE